MSAGDRTKETMGHMPMMTCPHCEKEWQWDDYYEVKPGSERDCPHCGAVIVVAWTETVLEAGLRVKHPPKTAGELTEEELELDLRAYGCCFYKFAEDGTKIRVHPQDVRFIKGEPRDSTNTVVVHQQEG